MYSLQTRDKATPSDKFDMSSHLLVGVISCFPLEEGSEIYPLHTYNSNKVLIQGVFSITKHDFLPYYLNLEL